MTEETDQPSFDARWYSGSFALSGHLYWQYWDPSHSYVRPEDRRNSIGIPVRLSLELSEKEALNAVQAGLEQNQVEWLVRHKRQWILRIDVLKAAERDFRDLAWLSGDIVVEPRVRVREVEVLGKRRKETSVSFVVDEAYLSMIRPRKIFLSHKSINKPVVRKYARVLTLLGFDPWLDEDAMPAGTSLERGLLKGFKDSCAAVFFITPEFSDASYLATEVDYALAEKRDKGERFAIVAIVFEADGGRIGVVPELLRTYVYSHPQSDIDALIDILRALPVEVGPVDWKEPLD